MEISIRDQALLGCRRLLNQLNRDSSTPTFGCFDRRYWSWKLTDFPEATFQRNIKPLCWFMDQPEAKSYKDTIAENIKAGFKYALDIQHKDGSYDQAYPNEHSYGATAFLLPDLISAYKTIKDTFSENEKDQIENNLKSSANFLCEGAELHGFIANHLAGAALALKMSYQQFADEKYDQESKNILNSILDKQSDEGWFPEYYGADPGYQTLCMYYLAQIYQIERSTLLKKALEKSLYFLQFFIHPDGTFGGEYGSRRTEIYYPGGIALLASEFPIAASMLAYMKESIRTGNTINVLDIDMGNLAPLLSNYVTAAPIDKTKKNDHTLPLGEHDLTCVFPNAGIAVISKPTYYAVLGSSNGGVLKVFNKASGKLIHNDCGFLGETDSGKKFSNQTTDLSNPLEWKRSIFHTSASFFLIPTQSPTPFNYLLLRIANLTIMRVRIINEWVKKHLVGMLINKKSPLPLSIKRTVDFMENTINITDKIEKTGTIRINSLVSGIKFSSIHMASSRYFSPAQLELSDPDAIDVGSLEKNDVVERTITIDLQEISRIKNNE
ncbi:MAG: hypothetical protein Q7J07_08350 [Pelolinea sp.]|nr:hypothetical protein [Pelolinea sp.]